MTPTRLTPSQVGERQRSGEALTFIDARSTAAWRAATTQLPGSIRVPPHEVHQHLHLVPQGETLIVYCT